MSYSRPGCLIDSVNGRRAGGYRRHPEVANHPEPEDYPSTAEYEWACAQWDDEPARNREVLLVCLCLLPSRHPRLGRLQRGGSQPHQVEKVLAGNTRL